MASGSFTSPGLGFNNTGGGSTGNGPACPAGRYEPRGPAVLLAGLCTRCGRATITRDTAGRPAHELFPWLIQ